MAFIHTFREIELMLRHRGAFGAVLGTHHPPIDVDGARLSMSRYTIPARLARARDQTLPLGAILALFDEVSTLNLVAVDRGRRPGVSVALSAWRAARAPLPRAGAVVAIESRVERCGRTLGFCEVALRDAESGAELARGRHVKFLPMGAVFDVMTRPALLPLALRVLVSRFSHSLSAVRLCSLCFRVLSTCTVLPVVSLSLSSSLLRSSIFSRYCWFSILS